MKTSASLPRLVGRYYPARAAQPQRVWRLSLLLLLAAGLLLGMLASLAQPAWAHELFPFSPPVAAACYATAKACELSQEGLARARLLALGTAETLTDTQATRAPDAKSWLSPADTLVSAGAIRAANRTPLFDTPCTNGFANIYPCENVDLLAFLPHTTIGGDTNNDMWGWTDPETGKEYALVGARDGVAFVDISTPTLPRYLGKLPTHAVRSSWRDLKVYRDHLFVVADKNNRHGLQLFDLRQLRTVTVTAGVTTTLLFSETAHYAGFSDAHNLAINEESGYAYAVGGETCKGGLHMVNIQNLAHPTYAGCYAGDGYIHDTQCVIYRGADQRYQGHELCFNASVAQFTIVDVTNKAKPTRLSTIAVEGNVYMHQGWLTPDQQYFLLDDEMDEWFGDHNTRTYVFDVRDIESPRFVDAYTAASPAVDHNLYISATYAYEANYTSGLRILDLKHLTQGQLSEAGFFDTYPENDEVVTSGAWTAYPFYQSGVVAISTLDRGLFLVRPRLPADVLFRQHLAEVNLCEPTANETQFQIPFDLSARNQYTQVVSLRAQQLPMTATATFMPAVVDMAATGHASSTLTVAGSTLASSPYTFTVEAVSPEGTILDTTIVRVHLAHTSASQPTLTAPLSTTVETLTPLTFRWSASDAISYTVEIADEPTFSHALYTTSVTFPELTLAAPLAYDRPYYWRVQANNRCGSTLSAVGSFRTPIAIFLPLVHQSFVQPAVQP
ncbi:MAG: choice-of-anchor B family protein [Caldilineaceae bacterium]|nr:choice-of-anchor B family protein [Caldilineaceae bacterium]